MAEKRKRRAKGEGTVSYRPADGRWIGRIIERGQEIVVYGRNAKETAERLRVARNRADRIPKHRITLDGWMQTWLTEARSNRHYAPGTCELYRSTIATHVSPTLGSMQLQKIGSEHIRDLLARLEAKDVSEGVRSRVRMILKACWAEAYLREYVAGNVVDRVRGVKAVRRRRLAIDLSVALAFIEAAQGDPNEALYLLLLGNGLRRGEVFGLYPEDVDCDRGLIHIRRQLTEIGGESPPKGGKTATVPLAPFVIPALRRHLAERAASPPGVPYLFTSSGRWPSSPRRGLRGSVFLRKVWQPFLKAHGIEQFVPHQLRHTTGTLLKLLGVPVETVRDILRHASITTTAEIYQDEIPAHMTDALKRLSGLLETR